MIEINYYIIIAFIILLLLVYYFYSEISNLKKSSWTSYLKIMSLEEKVIEFDKINSTQSEKNKPTTTFESPVFSLSYQSNMIKDGNLSVKYTDLSESEAKELLKNMDKYKYTKNRKFLTDKSPPQLIQKPSENTIKNRTLFTGNTESQSIKKSRGSTFSKKLNSGKSDSVQKNDTTLSPKLSRENSLHRTPEKTRQFLEKSPQQNIIFPKRLSESPNLVKKVSGEKTNKKMCNVQIGEISDHKDDLMDKMLSSPDNTIFSENSDTVNINISNITKLSEIKFNNNSTSEYQQILNNFPDDNIF